MKYIYILQLVVETHDEVKMVNDSVYTTREKAESMGKSLVDANEEYIGYYVSKHLIFR